MTGRRHPVGGELDVTDVADQCGGDVGDRLAHGHASRGCRVHQRKRRALAHGERFSAIGSKSHQRHRDVGHRHLPRADHLVARREAAHGAVADGDEEGLVRHGGKPQHAVRRFAQIDAGGFERRQLASLVRNAARHARRFSQQHRELHVDRPVVVHRVGHGEPPVIGCLPDHRERAALALADRAKAIEIMRSDRQHVALLGLVAPDLQRRHSRLLVRDPAQVEAPAALRRMHQLRQRVGKSPGPHVVDRKDRIGVAQRPAAINDFLCTALDLRVAALHRVEVEVFQVGAGIHAGSSTATQPDQHAGAAELDQQRAGDQPALARVARGKVADATGDHDRFVIAAHCPCDALLEGAKVAGEVGPAEFIVERGPADGAFQHDLQRRCDAPRPSVAVALPRLLEAGDAKVGYRESGEPRLGLGAATGSAFIANLAAGAGRGAREWRDRRRMVVGFHLHQGMDRFLDEAVLAVVPGIEALHIRPFHYGGVVDVGDHRTAGIFLVCGADHAEQRLGLRLAVDHPIRVEDLVPAVLGVGLSEHHQLDIGGIAADTGEIFREVCDFVFRQRKPHVAVGAFQDRRASAHHVHCRERPGLEMLEQAGGILKRGKHRFRHTVMYQGC